MITVSFQMFSKINMFHYEVVWKYKFSKDVFPLKVYIEVYGESMLFPITQKKSYSKKLKLMDNQIV